MSNYSNYYQSAFTYQDYKQLIIKLLAEDKTTGADHSEGMLHYTKMNLQRMNRVEKTVVLTEVMQAWISQISEPLKFLVITEGWCGDAAQIVPVLNKMVETNSEKLSMKCILRDEHLPLIDEHLTNNGRAIPVLLVLDKDGNLMKEKWGPRPAVLQELLKGWKDQGVEMPELAEKIHGWYAKDKTISTQESLVEYLQNL